MNKIFGKFKNDKSINKFGTSCVTRGNSEETNTHIMECDRYAVLRVGRDLTHDQDLVEFFREMMRRRSDLGIV